MQILKRLTFFESNMKKQKHTLLIEGYKKFVNNIYYKKIKM
jgi:hypothetical protein